MDGKNRLIAGLGSIGTLGFSIRANRLLYTKFSFELSNPLLILVDRSSVAIEDGNHTNVS